LSFSPDGKWLAGGTAEEPEGKWNGVVKLWDTRTWNEVRGFESPFGPLKALVFTPDGRLLLGLTDAWNGVVAAYDPATGQELASSPGGETQFYRGLALSPDGRRFATAKRGGPVDVWDAGSFRLPLPAGAGAAKGGPLRTVTNHEGGALCVAYSPRNDVLASGGVDGTVRLFDVTTGQELHRLTGHRRHVNALAFRPDGCFLASAGSDAPLRLGDVRAGKEVAVLRGHTDAVHAVAFSPDGRTLATGSADGTVKQWGR